MNTNIQIKICGVKDPAIAQAAVALGADLIGLVFHPASKRHVDMALAKSIAATTIAAGGIPVAVCVNQDANAMQAILDATGIQVVQLHGDIAKAAHTQLAAHYIRLYAQAINPDGSQVVDTTMGFDACLATRDYVLFDHSQAGSGITIPWDTITPPQGFRFGLAGGLNPGNVATALAQVQPTFVDVSSGVEDNQGEKDVRLIQAFIDAVKRGSHARN